MMQTPMYSGVITNYVCTAACRHCMFASAPDCPKEYITEEMSGRIAAILREAGTFSVHIGGGEPFMNFDALCTLIRALTREGIAIDYIETNAFWCSDEAFVQKRLDTLKELGASAVMVSVDPFHIEYVPLERPLLLCRLLQKNGFDYFIWQEKFLRRLMKLDRTKCYTGEELKEVLGENYIEDTAAEYGLGMNGRALAIAEKLYPKRKAEDWLISEACPSILRTRHCHFDLYGNVIPSGCPGISAEARDYLTGNITEEKYPVLSHLAKGGVRALYKYAKEKGFTEAEDGYPSRCSLCFAIRAFLLERENPSQDLSPVCFYKNVKKTMEDR